MHDSHTARSARRRTLLAFLALFAFAFALFYGVSNAYGITQHTVLTRAQRRIDNPVPYSQTKYYGGYRTDCSGYVSMCWRTGTSWNTRTFYKVTHRIPVSQLRPGDALLKKNYHIRLFYGWLDEAHTQYIAYESAYGIVAGTRIHSIADDLGFGYVPVRYDRIQSSPRSTNLMKNPSFNVWARAWSSAAEQPVWWEVTGPSWGTYATHRKDTYRSARNALALRNPSADQRQFARLSQTATVAPGATYRLSAWAKSASPSGIELGLTYLDAAGTTLAEKKLSGSAVGIDNSAFKSMSVQATAPADAVRARVTVRLAGGSVTTSAGVTAGTSVLLDDVSLVRPRVGVTIKASRSVAYSGSRLILSGLVWPTQAAGVPATVYIKRPGSSTYAKLGTTTLYAAGSSAAWRRTFTFTRKMPRGTYRFRTYVPAIPGYLGNTSKSVTVKLG